MAGAIADIKKNIEEGALQILFKSLVDNIRTKNTFDSSTLSIEHADIFSFYLYLSKSLSAQESFAKILEYLEWRERLIEMSSPASLDLILGCNVMNIYRSMPECHFGYDKAHRPVIYYLFGQQDIPATLKFINRKRIFDYHLWQNDAINELCYHKTLESGSMVSASTLIIDVVGMTSKTVSAEFLHILTRRAEVNGLHFPYLFDKIIIINAMCSDSKIICTLKDFCKSFSPRANVYVTGPERDPLDVLSAHIDPDQIPSEYGGLKGSIMAISHPFYDAVTIRRAGGGVSVHRQGGVSYTPVVTNAINAHSPSKDYNRKISVASTTLGAGVYDTDDDMANLSVSMGTTSIIDTMEDTTGRTFSTSSSRAPPSRANRSTSLSSSLSAYGFGSKADYVLSGVAMTPSARHALGAFVELMLGGSPTHSLLSLDMHSAPVGDGQTTISSLSPISNRSLDNSSLHTTPRPLKLPAAPPPFTVSLPLKPSVFSILIDGILQSSVGTSVGSHCNVLSLRTSTGVVLLKASPVSAPVNPSAAPLSAYPPKRITCKKYSGNLILSGGRVYSLTRGASMCGWLQKWPMKSQAAGGYTHRYFILEDNELKYWKIVPKGVSQQSGSMSRSSAVSTTVPHISDPPKGSMILTPNTTLRRAKTLFGSSIIEIKSEYDTLTVCAYNTVEDTAWYSELYHALERVKKIHRDECSNERPFPEVVWRQQDPSCVAVSSDVIDPTSFEESFQSYEAARSGVRRHSGREPSQSMDGMPRSLQYAVLCRVHTGLSSLHSVQIGPTEHAAIRLENTDLDLGVKLLSVKLCGDCLVLSGTNGFIGAGRIPHLADTSTGHSDSRRIYVRRLLNSFHGEDAIVNVLATPKYVAEEGQASDDVSRSLMASGDDLGGVCVWRRDQSAPGTPYNPAGSTTTRTGYTWTCIHHAKVGHKICSMSFSPDGKILAVCSMERALLFDISPLMVDAIGNTETSDNAADVSAIGKYNIRTVVLDDIVGINTTETLFAVDLSRIGVLKVWKVTEGFNVHGGPGGVDESSSRGDVGSNRNTGNIADRVSYVEMSLEQALRRSEFCVSLADFFTRRRVLSVSSPQVKAATPAHSVASDDVSSDGDDNSVSDQKDVQLALNAEESASDKHLVGEGGFCVDPFGYADVFVIDPLRMHLRDWWCDYSSRYLLLGHGRVSALTNFESPNVASKFTDASENAESGLNKRSSNMFWSTLTSSLGRRVICRYYIPLAYHERKKAKADVKLDCIHFAIVLSRCLYETLGDEYSAAMLASWKSAALDYVRNTLERISASWFRDISTVFLEVLRRMELSPSLALNSLDELIAAVGAESGVESATGSSVVDVSEVLELFTTLRKNLCLISDDYGIMHIVKSDRKRFVSRGIKPNSGRSGKSKSDNLLLAISTAGWEVEDAVHLVRSLVIEPLSHMERTEPFAVALAIVGLQCVPKFVYDSVMSQDENMRAAAEHQAAPSEDRTSAEKLAASVKRKKNSADKSIEENADTSIEGLISMMAREMPPWIRFILTSDTSDCDNTG